MRKTKLFVALVLSFCVIVSSGLSVGAQAVAEEGSKEKQGQQETQQENEGASKVKEAEKKEEQATDTTRQATTQGQVSTFAHIYPGGEVSGFAVAGEELIYSVYNMNFQTNFGFNDVMFTQFADNNHKSADLKKIVVPAFQGRGLTTNGITVRVIATHVNGTDVVKTINFTPTSTESVEITKADFNTGGIGGYENVTKIDFLFTDSITGTTLYGMEQMADLQFVYEILPNVGDTTIPYQDFNGVMTWFDFETSRSENYDTSSYAIFTGTKVTLEVPKDRWYSPGDDLELTYVVTNTSPFANSYVNIMVDASGLLLTDSPTTGDIKIPEEAWTQADYTPIPYAITVDLYDENICDYLTLAPGETVRFTKKHKISDTYDKDKMVLTPTVMLACDQQTYDPITIYFKKQNKQINYDLNGAPGQAPQDNRLYYSDESATVLGVGVTYDGHTFKGWNTKADGTGVSYNPADSLKFDDFNTDTVTLYAQWTPNKKPPVTPDKPTVDKPNNKPNNNLNISTNPTRNKGPNTSDITSTLPVLGLALSSLGVAIAAKKKRK